MIYRLATMILMLGALACGRSDSPPTQDLELFHRNQLQPDPRLSIRLNHSGRTPCLEVVGLEAGELEALAATIREPEHWRMVFFAWVADSKPEDAPYGTPIAGVYSVTNEVLRFEPRYPLTLGVRYQAIFHANRVPGALHQVPIFGKFELPLEQPGAAAVVEAVYPSREVLPENQLKFYIHFSTPMARGEAYRRIKLLESTGREVEFPFLELDEELWDPAGRRFTLFFDPGRIKRGLKPREEVGPALEEGKSYTLVVDKAWEDARGNPLEKGFRKSFRVTAPDDEPIEPKKWKLRPPRAGSSEPLVVELFEPLDRALLERMLQVHDADGKTLPGGSTVIDGETKWQFTPERPWQAASYRLVVPIVLEDLAGNKVGRAFDVDVFRTVTTRLDASTVSLPFEVR